MEINSLLQLEKEMKNETIITIQMEREQAEEYIELNKKELEEQIEEYLHLYDWDECLSNDDDQEHIKYISDFI